MNTSLRDAHKRQVNYLRLSITDYCNLACCYCVPSESGFRNPSEKRLAKKSPSERRLAKERLLSFEEMHRLVEIGVDLGITKVRITGGEPLCRPGIIDFIERLSRISGIKDIGLTTNGTRLQVMAPKLMDAGLNRINISLDTLSRERFKKITGKDKWQQVWDGIMSVLSLGFAPVKINTVAMKGVNDDELLDLAGLSLVYPLHVRFIEYMPIGPDPKAISRYFISSEKLKKRMGYLGELTPVVNEVFDGPAKRFKVLGAPGELGFISSMSNHFCEHCNRMRLTSRGALRPCLLADDQVRLLNPLRQGCTDSQLQELFFKALSMKKNRHSLSFEGGGKLSTKMVEIGG